ncbi:MAG: SDR family NAD(P)-dependent oxidoreductase [Gemmatimonas sp.]|nr:SDR family NAD(P)-dependent oxidoreductase [Gemmatimonas sp.]
MQGQSVLVTGGSSGIGLATARRFSEQGASVWITARDRSRLDRAVSELGSPARAFPSDVTDPDSLRSLIDEIYRCDGRLDVLINSAGQLELASAEDGVDIAERLMRVNYFGLARTVAAALPLLRRGSRKSIVSLSSFVGRIAPPYWSAYAASKHAVQAYIHSLRQELRMEGFHVGLVLPGPVRSPMTHDLLRTPMYPVPFGVPVLDPDRVARAILGAVLHRRSEVAVPARFGPLLRLGSAVPGLVDLLYRLYPK